MTPRSACAGRNDGDAVPWDESEPVGPPGPAAPGASNQAVPPWASATGTRAMSGDTGKEVPCERTSRSSRFSSSGR